MLEKPMKIPTPVLFFFKNLLLLDSEGKLGQLCLYICLVHT